MYIMNEKELKRLYGLYYKDICRFIYIKLDNLLLAQEIAQDSFISIWEKNKKFEDDKHAKAYLYFISRNKMLNVIKSKQYEVSMHAVRWYDSEYQNDISIFEDSEILEHEHNLIEILRTFIELLRPRSKEIIDLQLTGLTNPQIVNKLGISLSTVKCSKKTSYKKIKKFGKLNINFKPYYKTI